MSKKPKNKGSKDIMSADYRSFLFKDHVNTGVLKVSPHYLPHFLKKKYSISIYKGHKGNWSDLTKKGKEQALSKQWYIRWSYRNPITGRMERQKNLYGPVNSLKTYKERMQMLRHIKDNLIALLRSGFDPYDENEHEILSVGAAIEKTLEIKRLHMKEQSFVRFKSDINKFKKHLFSNGFERRFITSIKKKDVTDYLNEVLKTVSARSRNNYRASISALWQQMEEDGICTNIAKGIPMLKTIPQKNKAYTDKEVKQLFAFMDKNCPNLLLFVKFVAYSFLRPIEVCRLTAHDLDMEKKRLTVMVKQGREVTKTIPDILIDEIPNIPDLETNVLIFGKDMLFNVWNAKEDRRRAYFTSEFSKVRDKLGFSKDKNLYSFRHWATGKIYRSLRDSGLTPYETKAKLMTITGHATMSALEKYLRTIDVELADDYSKLF